MSAVRSPMSRSWTVTKDKFLTSDEVQRLYGALGDAKDLALQRKTFYCHIRDYFILRTLLESGLRVFELAALRVSDFRAGCLVVRNGKGGKRRDVLLAKETQKMLGEFLKLKARVLGEPTGDEDSLFVSERSSRYTTRGIRRRVKHWFAQCELSTSLSCHSCRHSYASHLLARTGDLPLTRDNLGHSSLSVTSIYSHSLRDDLGDIELYSSQKIRKRN
jgi:site-specific recombinase XerD